MSLNYNLPHAESICKVDQGADCCKYLAHSMAVVKCLKENAEDKQAVELQPILSENDPQGDNCIGYSEYYKEKNRICDNPNQNDKRYEDPFEDDGAYADDTDDE